MYAAKRFSCGPGAERRDPTKQFYIKMFFYDPVVLEELMILLPAWSIGNQNDLKRSKSPSTGRGSIGAVAPLRAQRAIACNGRRDQWQSMWPPSKRCSSWTNARGKRTGVRLRNPFNPRGTL